MAVRCKLAVSVVVKHSTATEEVNLYGVYSPDPNHENRAFWNATPNAQFKIYIDNPNAHGFFQQGKEYYVDFTPAE